MGLSDGQGTVHKLHYLVIETFGYLVKIYNLAILKNGLNLQIHIPYPRHYKPRLVFFFTHFSLRLRLIMQSGH
jgi:hypothetical protein